MIKMVSFNFTEIYSYNFDSFIYIIFYPRIPILFCFLFSILCSNFISIVSNDVHEDTFEFLFLALQFCLLKVNVLTWGQQLLHPAHINCNLEYPFYQNDIHFQGEFMVEFNRQFVYDLSLDLLNYELDHVLIHDCVRIRACFRVIYAGSPHRICVDLVIVVWVVTNLLSKSSFQLFPHNLDYLIDNQLPVDLLHRNVWKNILHHVIVLKRVRSEEDVLVKGEVVLWTSEISFNLVNLFAIRIFVYILKFWINLYVRL